MLPRLDRYGRIAATGKGSFTEIPDARMSPPASKSKHLSLNHYQAAQFIIHVLHRVQGATDQISVIIIIASPVQTNECHIVAASRPEYGAAAVTLLQCRLPTELVCSAVVTLGDCSHTYA